MLGGLSSEAVADLPFTVVLDHVRAARRIHASEALKRFQEASVAQRGKAEAVRKIEAALTAEAGVPQQVRTVDDLFGWE